MFERFIIDPMREFAQYILSMAMQGIVGLISMPTKLDELPYILDSVKLVQWIAGSFLLVVVMFEIIKTMVRAGYGDSGKPLDKILLDAVKAAVLIYLTPYIINNVLIPLNNAVIRAITQLSFGDDPTLIEHALDNIIPTVAAIGQILVHILLAIVLGIGMLILTILAGFRIAQIGFLMVIGPILAVSNANEGQAFKTWVIESVAVVFTQCVHVWLLGYLGSLIIRGGFWDIMGALGVLALMIMGPSVLKQYLHQSGVGGAVSGAVRMAAYQRLSRGVLRR